MNKKKYLGYGIRPSDKEFFKITKTQYEAQPQPKLGEYDLVLNTPTVKAYADLKAKTIVLSIRGTTDGRDVGADTMIPFNRLKYSNRYTEDRNIIASLINQYSPEEFDYYGTGHSLGSALLRQLQREFPFIKDTVTFNGAVQPYDIVDQKANLNKSYYTEDDALYKLGGRLLTNKIVLPSTENVVKLGALKPIVPSSVKMGTFVYNAAQGHKLDNFENVLGGTIFNYYKNYKKTKGGCCMCHIKDVVRGGAIEERQIESLEDFKTTELRKIASIFNKFFKIKLTKLTRNEIIRELSKYIYLNESGSIFVNEDDLFFSLKPKDVLKEIESKKLQNKIKKEEKPKTRREILQKEKIGVLKALLISLGGDPTYKLNGRITQFPKRSVIDEILVLEKKNKKNKNIEESVPVIKMTKEEEELNNMSFKQLKELADSYGPDATQIGMRKEYPPLRNWRKMEKNELIKNIIKYRIFRIEEELRWAEADKRREENKKQELRWTEADKRREENKRQEEELRWIEAADKRREEKRQKKELIKQLKTRKHQNKNTEESVSVVKMTKEEANKRREENKRQEEELIKQQEKKDILINQKIRREDNIDSLIYSIKETNKKLKNDNQKLLIVPKKNELESLTNDEIDNLYANHLNFMKNYNKNRKK